MKLIITLALATIVTSCSTSRLIDSERVLAPGHHKFGTIFESDLVIPAGCSLEVAFSSENRFYVASGGRLTGFQKGVRGTRIYAEKGAGLPPTGRLKGITVITVKSAREAYRRRFDPLPPLKSRSSTISGFSSSDDDDDDDYFRRGPAPSSVTPSSYQKKN